MTLTDAVIARVSEGLTCGDADTPPFEKRPDGRPVAPYAVVYPLPLPEFGGSLTDPRQWMFHEFEVVVVAATRDHAEHGQEVVRGLLEQWVPDMVGHPFELSQGSGVDRDDSVKPAIFYTADRFQVFAS